MRDAQVVFAGRVAACPQRSQEPMSKQRIAVGDAAVAFSPSSGHGVSFALASALSAAAVIHTRFTRVEWSAHADTYYQDMCKQAWIAHVQSLDLSQTDRGFEILKMPAWIRFSAEPTVVGLLKGEFIQPECAYRRRDGSAVRWLGSYDLALLEKTLSDWMPTRTVIERLANANGKAIVARCLKEGLLEGKAS
jgi:hypothetical protein